MACNATDEGFRMSPSATLCSARSGHEVLRILPIDTEHRRCTSTDAAPRSPNLNAFAKRWGSVQQECLSKLILFGESSLKRALTEFTQHYHSERNHQEKDNVLLFPPPDEIQSATDAPVRCRQRLRGLLK